MPKSQFDAELVIRGGLVHGQGPFQADPPGSSGEPARSVIFWMLDQGGVIAFSADEHHGDGTWHADARADPALRTGRAQAVGVVLSLDDRGAQAFSWSQDVTLRRD